MVNIASMRSRGMVADDRGSRLLIKVSTVKPFTYYQTYSASSSSRKLLLSITGIIGYRLSKINGV